MGSSTSQGARFATAPQPKPGRINQGWPEHPAVPTENHIARRPRFVTASPTAPKARLRLGVCSCPGAEPPQALLGFVVVHINSRTDRMGTLARSCAGLEQPGVLAAARRFVGESGSLSPGMVEGPGSVARSGLGCGKISEPLRFLLGVGGVVQVPCGCPQALNTRAPALAVRIGILVRGPFGLSSGRPGGVLQAQ